MAPSTNWEGVFFFSKCIAKLGISKQFTKSNYHIEDFLVIQIIRTFRFKKSKL